MTDRLSKAIEVHVHMHGDAETPATTGVEERIDRLRKLIASRREPDPLPLDASGALKVRGRSEPIGGG